MSASSVTLRLAAPDDVDRVFSWANDPTTRAASFRSDPIPYEDHVRWFEGQLGSDQHRLFIAVDAQGEAVGVYRLSGVEPGQDPVVSINVAPEARGRGVGLAILEAGSEQARALGCRKIIAFIRPDNEASLRIFGRAGYQRQGRTLEAGQDADRFELDLVPSGAA